MLQNALLIALVVLFAHVTSWPGMINNWLARLAFNWPDWVKKPIFDCPICMAPWWGSIILLAYGLIYHEWLRPLDWIMTVFAAGGVNAVLIYMIASDKEEIKDDE